LKHDPSLGIPSLYDSPMATLKPGDPAPTFELSEQSGRKIKLGDFKNRMVLVYFYPKADTPGCTTQSCAVRDHRQDLGTLGVDVVGISPDPPEKQLAFDEKYSLGFPLLSDTDHSVAEAWGVWGERKMYGKTFMGISRSAFLIDERGNVSHAWYGVKPDDTVPNVVAALET